MSAQFMKYSLDELKDLTFTSLNEQKLQLTERVSSFYLKLT